MARGCVSLPWFHTLTFKFDGVLVAHIRPACLRLGQYSANVAVNPLTYGVGIAISLFVNGLAISLEVNGLCKVCNYNPGNCLHLVKDESNREAWVDFANEYIGDEVYA